MCGQYVYVRGEGVWSVRLCEGGRVCGQYVYVRGEGTWSVRLCEGGGCVTSM